MQISEKGLVFIAGHEGFVSRAYLDPIGILTIGYGFTMRGRVFADFWRTKQGRGLEMGDRISREDADAILKRMIEREYGAAVQEALPGLDQHQYDGCVSVVYNLGPRALKWKWAKALKAGDVERAARLLTNTGTTASGRKLRGLVRRRKEEAALLLRGDYAGVPEGIGRAARDVKSIEPDPVVREAQELLTARGFNPGAIDGWMGKKTKAAVLAYQSTHPHLTNDGIIGPATLAQLRRDAMAVQDAVAGGGGVGGLGLLSFFTGLPWGWIIGVGLAVLVLWLLHRYRDVIVRRVLSIFKRKVA